SRSSSAGDRARRCHRRPIRTSSSDGTMTERVWVVLAVGTALAVFPHVSAAEVYRWVDAHGAVTYSDRPQPPSEVVAPAPEPVSVRKATPAAPPVEQTVGVYAAGLKANPPPAPRVELLQKLDWISGTTETSADIVAAVTRSVSKAVSATSPPAQSLRPGQIESRAEEIRTRVSE